MRSIKNRLKKQQTPDFTETDETFANLTLPGLVLDEKGSSLINCIGGERMESPSNGGFLVIHVPYPRKPFPQNPHKRTKRSENLLW